MLMNSVYYYYQKLMIIKAPGVFLPNGLSLTTIHRLNGAPFPLNFLQVQV